jgi:hypothetical protein
LAIPYLLQQHRLPANAALLVPIFAAVAIAAAAVLSLRRYGYAGLRFITLVPAVLAIGIAVRAGAPALDATLSARPVAAALQTFDSHHLPVAVFMVSRETEFGLQFYRNQTILRYELGQVPDGEHLLVAPGGRERGVARNTLNRKITYLGYLPAQNLKYFYVGAVGTR